MFMSGCLLSVCVCVTVCGLSSSRLWFLVKHRLREDTQSLQMSLRRQRTRAVSAEGEGPRAPAELHCAQPGGTMKSQDRI